MIKQKVAMVTTHGDEVSNNDDASDAAGGDLFGLGVFIGEGSVGTPNWYLHLNNLKI